MPEPNQEVTLGLLFLIHILLTVFVLFIFGLIGAILFFFVFGIVLNLISVEIISWWSRLFGWLARSRHRMASRSSRFFGIQLSRLLRLKTWWWTSDLYQLKRTIVKLFNNYNKSNQFQAIRLIEIIIFIINFALFSI